MAFAVVLFVTTLANSMESTQAIDFLGAQGRGQSVAKGVVEQLLLNEFSGSANGARLAALQEDLQPTFAALPKNAQGQLEPSTVRYALHRYFMQKHGWSVKGLDPEGGTWNSTSSSTGSDVMKGLAPIYIQDLFAKRLQGHGLRLEDLAVFAATLSDLVIQESLGSFRAIFDKIDVSIGEHLSDDEFDLAMRAFLADLITGEFGSFTGKDDFAEMESLAKEFYPEYDDIVMWIRDLHTTHEFLDTSLRNPFIPSVGVSFDRAANFLREFVQNLGSLPEVECRSLKEDLLAMEQSGTGRVLLSDFYKHTGLQVKESVDYLRNLGVLESENGTPRLVIANYITSPSRCMPFSSYYSVCCPDECDGLLGQLEREIGHPSALPARIVEIVSNMPSDTVDAPRNLSTSLLTRLGEIGSHHGGEVPMHGRLFMQWMHHVYPRECGYPHESGTTRPVTQDEWLAQNEHLDDAMASEEEKATHINARRSDDYSLDLEDLPWYQVEELVAQHQVEESESPSDYFRVVVCGVLLLSFALPLMRASLAFFASDDKVHSV